MALHVSGEGLDKLSDEQIGDVAGGLVHFAGRSNGISTYEVIDDKTLEVLASFSGKDALKQAEAKCEELGMSTDGITDSQLSSERYWRNQG